MEEITDPLSSDIYTQYCTISNFPGETFSALKEKCIRKFVDYHTHRLVLEGLEQF